MGLELQKFFINVAYEHETEPLTPCSCLPELANSWAG